MRLAIQEDAVQILQNLLTHICDHESPMRSCLSDLQMKGNYNCIALEDIFLFYKKSKSALVKNWSYAVTMSQFSEEMGGEHPLLRNVGKGLQV